MVDMWLADKLFSRPPDRARIVLVGEPYHRPHWRAATVLRELRD